MILKWVSITLVVLVACLTVYVWMTWNRTWDVPVPELRASADPGVIARGEYLVYGPAHCPECHAEPEALAKFVEGGPRPDLMGGRAFPAPPLGTIYAANITPDPDTGIGRYSDGQIVRML